MDSQSLTTTTARPVSSSTQAVRDWRSAFQMWRLWTALGLEDLSDRYRRTALGVSWVITSFVTFIAVKSIIFGQMAGVSFAEFTLYVTLGFGLWTFINNMVTDCCLAYTASSNWILGVAIPYPVFFLQSIFRNWLVFALVMVAMIAALIWFKTSWTLYSLAALPGLLVYVYTPLWLSAILAPMCARYRDMQHAVRTGLTMLFFATPILWMPGKSESLFLIAHYNFATHFLEIVRDPLIYDRIPYKSWAVVLIINAVGTVAGFFTYAATRNRIVYWL
jgi:ABC-type polysaccharide/polyol phosphate export permease